MEHKTATPAVQQSKAAYCAAINWPLEAMAFILSLAGYQSQAQGWGTATGSYLGTYASIFGIGYILADKTHFCLPINSIKGNFPQKGLIFD